MDSLHEIKTRAFSVKTHSELSDLSCFVCPETLYHPRTVVFSAWCSVCAGEKRTVIQLRSCFCSFFKLNKRTKLCFLAFAFVSWAVFSHLLCHPISLFFLLPYSLGDLCSCSGSSLQKERGSHSSCPQLCLQLWGCVSVAAAGQGHWEHFGQCHKAAGGFPLQAEVSPKVMR